MGTGRWLGGEEGSRKRREIAGTLRSRTWSCLMEGEQLKRGGDEIPSVNTCGSLVLDQAN